MWKEQFKSRFFGISDSIVAAIIIAVVVYGGSLLTAWYSAQKFQLAGVAPQWAILIGVGVFLVVALAVNFISLAIARLRTPNAKKTSKKIEQVQIAEIETRNARIEELEREKTSLTRGRNEDAVFIRQYKSSIEQLSQEISALKSRWDGHVFQYSWLFAKVEAQGKSINSYVEVEKAYFCYQELLTPMLKSVFAIDLFNKSVFDVAIENKVSGYIEANGTRLAEPPLIIFEPGIIGLGSKGTITIEQRLTRAEADFIASKNPKSAEFDLSKLIINIKGSHFAESQPLTIPKRLHTDPQVEIASLKSEMAAIIRSHAEEIEKLKKEPQSIETQLWHRVKITRALSETMGYGRAIKDSGQVLNMTFPKPEIDEWARQLWEVLRWCFEESDIEKFYSGIDPKCPGYERGVPRLIKVPESNEERQLWLFYHLKRLSELINEQQHATTIIRNKVG